MGEVVLTPQPRDPEFETRVRASFARQGFMSLLGARVAALMQATMMTVLERPDMSD